MPFGKSLKRRAVTYEFQMTFVTLKKKYLSKFLVEMLTYSLMWIEVLDDPEIPTIETEDILFIKEIAQGGQGEVVKVLFKGKLAAVKSLLVQYFMDSMSVSDFLHEIKLMRYDKTLDNPLVFLIIQILLNFTVSTQIQQTMVAFG